MYRDAPQLSTGHVPTDYTIIIKKKKNALTVSNPSNTLTQKNRRMMGRTFCVKIVILWLIGCASSLLLPSITRRMISNIASLGKSTDSKPGW